MAPTKRTPLVTMLACAVIAGAVCAGALARASREPAGAGRDGTAPVRKDDKAFPVERTIPPPRPVAPADGTVLAGTDAVRLTWRLDDRTDGARIELSPTCDFDESSIVRFDHGGDGMRVPLVEGTWCWRVRGRSDGAVGERTSETRSFRVTTAPMPEPPVVAPAWDRGNPYERLIHGVPLEPTRDMR